LLQVDADITDVNAAVFRVVLDGVVDVGVVEEGLGGNASDVEASAAESTALLDASDLWPRKGETLEQQYLYGAPLFPDVFIPSCPPGQP
jgi:hypothetical protein